MKICYIADAQRIHTQRWAEWFANRGHDVYVISEGENRIEGVKTHKSTIVSILNLIDQLIIPTRITLWIKQRISVMKIRMIIDKIKPDIVHGHYLSNGGFYATLSGFHPLVVSAWGSDVLVEPKTSTKNMLNLKYVLKKADVVLGESEKIKEEILKYTAPKKLLIIPWGVNINELNPDINPGEIKNSLSINDSLTVISTRHFNPIYSVDTLIKSIPIVTKEIPGARFMLKGFEKDFQLYKSKMDDLAKNLNVSDFIRFVSEVDYTEIPKYLNAADIYVSTSLSDSCSVSLLEAMACGLPVVVSNEPSNFEWIKDSWNGYIFERKNYKELAEKLIMLLKDKEKRKLFGKRNREIIEKRGDWNKNMEKVEYLYENLINKYKK